MNEPAAPAADIMGGVGVPEAVRMQRQAREGLLPGPWLNETVQRTAARETINLPDPSGYSSDDGSDYSGGYNHRPSKIPRRSRLGPIVHYPKPTGVRFDPRKMGASHAKVVNLDLFRKEGRDTILQFRG